MRRKDKQVTGAAIREIIDRCKVARLAMIDGDRPYLVPMNFGYFMQNGVLTLFFHCAHEGRKIDILRANNKVFFEMDCDHELVDAPAACRYSFAYASVMGEGTVQFVESEAEKFAAFEMIMLHQTGRAGFSFEASELQAVTVLKLVSTDYTAKQSGLPT